MHTLLLLFAGKQLRKTSFVCPLSYIYTLSYPNLLGTVFRCKCWAWWRALKFLFNSSSHLSIRIWGGTSICIPTSVHFIKTRAAMQPGKHWDTVNYYLHCEFDVNIVINRQLMFCPSVLLYRLIRKYGEDWFTK